jgi:hypothetical protein
MKTLIGSKYIYSIMFLPFSISITIYLCFLIIDQWINRLQLGIDLSDEAFNLNQQDFRLMENKDYVMPYTEVTHLIYKFVGGDVYRFRLFGIAILLILSLAPAVIILLKSLLHKKFLDIRFEPYLLFILSVLLIPSTFGFLLLTPGYQWLVGIGHSIIFSTIFLFPKVRITNADKILILVLVNSGVCLTLLGRFSSGMLLLAISFVYIALNVTKLGKHFLIFELLAVSALFFILILVFDYHKKIIFGIKATSSLQSENLNLISEITDTTKGVLFFSFVIFFQFFYLRILLKFKYKVNILIVFPIVMLNIFISNYLFEFWKNYFTFSQSFLLFLFTSVSGLIVALSRIKISQLFLYIPLGCLPILSNFGSSNSIFTNEQPYYQSSIYFVIVGILLFMQDIKKKILNTVFFLLLILSVIFAIFVNSYSNQTYGKLLKEQNNLVTYSKDSLLYSKERIKNMTFFKYNAQLNGMRENEKVLDLSYWHPGLARMLEISSVPFGQWDKFYKSTLQNQFTWFNPNNQNVFNKFQSNLMFLSIPNDFILKNRISLSQCYPIEYFLSHDSELLDILRLSGPYSVKMISYYVSRPEDMTLYPDYAILVKNCSL